MIKRPKTQTHTKSRGSKSRAHVAPFAPTSILGAALLLGSVGTLAACPAQTGADSAKPANIDVERFKVDLRDEEFALGGDTPLVTVVMFSDYACGPCGRTWQVMDNLIEDYGEDLRVVYRSYTVAGHVQGDTAAEAAFAAGAQGKFWEMHRLLFANTDGFSRPSLRAHAEELGLDVPKFFDDLDTGAFSGPRMRDRRQATALGIRALPVAFINGLFLMGAPPEESAWHSLIDEEIKRSRQLMQEGTKRNELYAAYMETARSGAVGGTEEERSLRVERMAEKAAEDAEKRMTLVRPEEGKRYAVPVADAATMGPEDAPVVVVEFLDFQCPYCRQTHTEVMPVLREKYKGKVRFVARHLPLEIHPAATGAAKAAVAAGRQSKFWDYHDKLLADDKGFGRLGFLEMAREVGLDIERFQADLDDPAVQKVVDDDIALSRALGVSGTPGIFVNGKYVHGFHPASDYEGLIDADLAAADKLIQGGTPRAKVHAELMKDAVPETEFPNPTSVGGDG